jgi:hypothetical protein
MNRRRFVETTAAGVLGGMTVLGGGAAMDELRGTTHGDDRRRRGSSFQTISVGFSYSGEVIDDFEDGDKTTLHPDWNGWAGDTGALSITQNNAFEGGNKGRVSSGSNSIQTSWSNIQQISEFRVDFSFIGDFSVYSGSDGVGDINPPIGINSPPSYLFEVWGDARIDETESGYTYQIPIESGDRLQLVVNPDYAGNQISSTVKNITQNASDSNTESYDPVSTGEFSFTAENMDGTVDVPRYKL